MSAKLLGYAWNVYLKKNIGIYLPESGAGYKRIISAIDEDTLSEVYARTKRAFEAGKLFNPADAAKTEYIEISNPAMHSSPLDARSHITTRSKAADHMLIKTAHVTQDPAEQTPAP